MLSVKNWLVANAVLGAVLGVFSGLDPYGFYKVFGIYIDWPVLGLARGAALLLLFYASVHLVGALKFTAELRWWLFGADLVLALGFFVIALWQNNAKFGYAGFAIAVSAVLAAGSAYYLLSQRDVVA